MGNTDDELAEWVQLFEQDKQEAALSFWYDMHKGTLESLRKF
jgi:glyceraldehyde-3-phosphate dehydrogenase (ferredoxin)